MTLVRNSTFLLILFSHISRCVALYKAKPCPSFGRAAKRHGTYCGIESHLRGFYPCSRYHA